MRKEGKEQDKSRKKLLYQLNQKDIRCLTQEFTIFYPYGEDPDTVPEICNLRKEFNFSVQFVIV